MSDPIWTIETHPYGMTGLVTLALRVGATSVTLCEPCGLSAAIDRKRELQSVLQLLVEEARHEA